MPSCFEGFVFDLAAWPDEAGNISMLGSSKLLGDIL